LETVNLDDQTIEKLGEKIAEKFLQGVEDLLIRDDNSLLSLILRHHFKEVVEEEQKKRNEAYTLERASRISSGDLRPLSVFNDPVNVKAENEHWQREKRKEQ